MKRLWLGVVLMAWSSVVSLFLNAPAAQAAGETYAFTSANTIHATGGAFGGGIDFTLTGTTFAATRVVASGRSTLTLRWEITGVTKTGNGFTGTVKAVANTNAPNGTINIGDPNNVGAAPAAPAPSPAANGNADPPDCDAGGFTWLICGALKALVFVDDSIRDYIIVPFLDEKPLDKNFTAPDGSQPNKPIYDIWSAIRNVAMVLFILIFFLIIFGTALGLDNYTVKKVLPRLIAGAILVPFSWYICVIIIDVGNVLGQGLLALTSSLIPSAGIDFRSNISKLFLGGTIVLVGAAAVAGIATISLGVVLTILIALFGVFLTLIFRKILIVVLIILSPLALVMWILPNTEKWYRLWWTNLFKLVMMYPLIMLLFESGRLFAYAAGSITGNANASFKGIFQITGLFAPTFLIPWTFKWVGGALAIGQNQINRLTSNLDKRFGKDSDMAKDRAAERERMNLIREKNAATKGQNFKAMMFRARSGVGAGYGGLGKGGFQAQMRREEKLSAARTATAKYGANKQTGEIPHAESATERIAAEQRQMLDQIAADRAGRHGTMQAMSEMGNNSRDVTRSIYNAARTNAARDYGKKIGTAKGTNDAEQAHGQSAADVADHARTMEGEHGAKARGEVTGTNRTADEVDGQVAGDANIREINARRAARGLAPLNAIQEARARALSVTAGIGMADARIGRLQGATANAAKGAKDHFTDEHGATVGNNLVEADIENHAVNAALTAARARAAARGTTLTPTQEAATAAAARAALSQQRTNTGVAAAALGARVQSATAEETKNQRANLEGLAHESTRSIIQGASLEARNKIAAEKQDRMRRLSANYNTSTGRYDRVTDRQALSAAGFDAEEKATNEVGDQIAALRAGRQARLEGDTTQRRIEGAIETGELKRGNAAGDRRGMLASRDADRRKVANELSARGIVPTAARVDRQRISERIAVAAEHAEEKYSADSGARRTTLEAAHTAEATAHAEGRDYHQDLLLAGGVKAKKDADAKAGQMQGLIDSIPEQNDHATDQAAARTSTVKGEVKAAGDRRGIVTGQTSAENRAIERSTRFGRPAISRDQARANIMRSISDSAEAKGQRAAVTEVAEAEGNLRGVRAAETKAMADARRVGRSIDRATARELVMAGAGDAAAIDARNKTLDVAANDEAVVTDDTANFTGDARRIRAKAYTTGKDLGDRAGNINAIREVAASEAARDGVAVGSAAAAIASSSRAARASKADETKRLSEKFGAQQSTINAGETEEGRLTADEMSEQAENAANIERMEGAQQIKGKLDEQRKAIESAKGGKITISDDEANHQASQKLMANAGANARHKARMDTGKAYEEAAGAAEGIQDEITAAQDYAREQGIPLSKDATKAREQARELMYSSIANTAERTGYNKVVADVEDARGIQEGRRLQREAAKEEIAALSDDPNFTAADVSDDEANALIGRGAAATIAKEAREKLLASTGKEIGTARGEEADIDDEAKRLQIEAAKTGKRLTNTQARNQARQNIATDLLRKNTSSADIDTTKTSAQNRGAVEVRDNAVTRARNDSPAPISRTDAQRQLIRNAREEAYTNSRLNAGNEYGTSEGAAETAEAAIREEMENTVGQETLFERDVVLADGKIIPGRPGAPARIPAGTKLAPGQSIPADRIISRDQAVANITRNAVSAGKESGIRSQVNKQAEVAALAQAAASDTGTAAIEARMAGAVQDRLDASAAETAKINASQADVPGQPGFRTYDQRTEDLTRVATNRLLDERIAQARRSTPEEFHGVAIENVELSNEKEGGNTGILAALVKRSLSQKDYATAVAAAERLNKSNGGFKDLVEQVRYAPIEENGFGGNFFDTVDPSADPIMKTLWDKSTTSDNGDAKKPIIAAATSISPENLARKAPQEVDRLLQYFREAGNPDADLGITKALARQVAISKDTSRPKEQRDAAAAAVKRYTDLANKKPWEQQAKKFSESLDKMIDLYNKGDIRSVEPDVIRTLAKELSRPDDQQNPALSAIDEKTRTTIEELAAKLG
jgi:hypothetical protein